MRRLKQLVFLSVLSVLIVSRGYSQGSSDIARHIQWGQSLPGRCRVSTGDIFFKTTATVGAYSCGPTDDNWVSMTGGTVTSGFDTLLTGTNTGAVMTVGTGAQLTFSGTGVVNASKINGATLGTTTATAGNVLIGSGTAWVTQAISGDITITSGGVVAIGATKVTNAMLAGSIAASKLIGTDITTVGTVTLGTWNATTIAIAKGGTGQTTQQAGFDALAPTATIAGSIIYWSGSHWVKLDGNASGTNCLQENSSGVPTWASCGSGGGGIAISGDGGTQYSEPVGNFISGTGISVTVADDPGVKVNVTIAVSSADVVMIAGTQNVTGAKTFDSFSLTPSSTFTTNARIGYDNTSDLLFWGTGNATRFAAFNPGTTAGSISYCTDALTPCTLGSLPIGGTQFQGLSVVAGALAWRSWLASDITNAFDVTLANTLTAVSAPSAPAAGFLAIYYKSGSTLCVKNSSGTETCGLGAGGGSPGGSGTEIQYRGGSTTFSALANSSVPNAGTMLLGQTPPSSSTASVIGMGTAITAGSSSGNYVGINAANGFGGNYLQIEENGTIIARLDHTGGLLLSGSDPTLYIYFSGTFKGYLGNVFGYQALGQSSEAGVEWTSSSNAAGTVDTRIARNAAGIIEINNGSSGTGGGLVIPAQKSSTGQRYVCIDTNGKLVSSAAACVGT